MFLLFNGYEYYPEGGFDDFSGSFETIEDAKQKHDEGKSDGDQFSWGHIVNSENFEIVGKCRYGDWESND